MEPTPFSGLEDVFEAIKEEIAQFRERPLIVSIMGQTGVGKTSLLKALFNKVLFNQSIVVDDVHPATRKPETYKIRGKNGQLLIVNDLPGIGESSTADQNHLSIYQNYFGSSDIVLWAILADSRSTTFDVQAIEHLLKDLEPDEEAQKKLMSKIVFVLTKADTLLPAPWFMEYHSSSVKFSPSLETNELIERKQQFFQQQLIQPFDKYVVSRTHNDVNFSLNDLAFSFDKETVTHQGLLTKDRVQKLSTLHPEFKRVFERLYDNYCPVPCSARFKYYLPKLMLIILNKLGLDVVHNFQRIVDLDRLGYMTLDEARQLCNLLIWNMSDRRKILDLELGIFPDPARDVIFYRGNRRSQSTGYLKKMFSFRRQHDQGQ